MKIKTWSNRQTANLCKNKFWINQKIVRFTKIYTNCYEIQNTRFADFEFQKNLCKYW